MYSAIQGHIYFVQIRMTFLYARAIVKPNCIKLNKKDLSEAFLQFLLESPQKHQEFFIIRILL